MIQIDTLSKVVEFYKKKGRSATLKNYNLKETSLNRYLKDSRLKDVDKGRKKNKDKSNKSFAKTLILDIETSPILAYVWGVWKQNISPVQVVADWKMLTWAAKWIDEDSVMSDAIIHHNENLDDFEVTESMWQLLDKADIVVAHNGRKFDVKKINTKFLYHGFTPPSPYKVIDTLLIARGNFAITYNKLDYISKFLGEEGKMEHEGFELWLKCMKNDRDAWKTMLEYNERDVTELEVVYKEIRGWDSRHPSVSIFNPTSSDFACTKCGSNDIVYKKPAYTNTRVYNLFRCNKCGAWSRSRAGKNKKDVLMTQ